MNDKNKTKDKLIDELTKLRKRITGLKKCETERWKAEETLRECEEKYRNVVELSPAVIVTANLKGIITSCSFVIKKITGYSREEIIGKHFIKLPFLRSKDISQYIKIFTSLLKGKVPEPFEIEVIHKEGTFRYLEICVGLLKKEDKKTGIQLVGLDLTVHKECDKVQSSLYRISESAYSIENFDELYRSIHYAITDLIPASSNFYIALYDKDFETVDFPYFVDEFIENAESQRLIKELIGYVLRSGKPLLASPEVVDKLRLFLI